MEIEGVDSENEGVENEVLPPDQKVYHLHNPSTIKYNSGRSNWISMGWSNRIVGSHAFPNVVKTYINVINTITTFVEPIPPTNITTNETILNQYIKQGLNFFEQKGETLVQK